MLLNRIQGNRAKQDLDRWLPVAAFVICLFVIMGATAWFAPSWGLMDDKAFLDRAVAYWKNPSNISIVTGEFNAAGMFRPVVFIWGIIFYKVFEHWPTGFYMFNAFWNMASMVLWGSIFNRFFNVRREDFYWSVFFFPLAFFAFTPYWNLFTYLSLQEKFIIFLTPIAFYLFQNTYRQGRPRDWIFLYFFIVLGMLCKATFIFVPVAMAVYAVVDLVFLRSRFPVSLIHLLITGCSLGYYAFYTVAVQLKGDYTAKFKSGLTISALISKVMGATVLAKALLLTGVIGFFVYFVWTLRSKDKELFFPALIYCGLVVHLMLLLLWGMHSYLLSAIGPLALGAFFPVYAWTIRKDGWWKHSVNIVIVILICLVFVGNNIPSISRMADMGKAITFLREREGGSRDVYFMPPGYAETAQTTEKFTGKRVYYCGDGYITEDLLVKDGSNYLILIDLLPSIDLAGVKAGQQIYANGTWQVYELMADQGNKERFSVEFKKTILQKLKIKIRDT